MPIILPGRCIFLAAIVGLTLANIFAFTPADPPVFVLSKPDDPYFALAVEIAEREHARLSKTLDDALGLSPDYLIWVASPMHFSDKDLVELGRKVRRTGILPAIGFITASSIEKARQLSSRTAWRDAGWAMAHGAWNGRDTMIEFGQAGGRKESLNPLSFRRALI
ncbi:MAG: hypothetical protein EHM61_20100, partial [Acidobacteria bacterium]